MIMIRLSEQEDLMLIYAVSRNHRIGKDFDFFVWMVCT